MQNYRRLVITLSVLLLSWVCPGHTSGQNKHSILGKWDSRIRSNGSGITLEFFSNGTFKQNSDFEKAGRYALKGNRLTTYTWDGKERREKQRVFELRPDSNRMTLKESNTTVEIHMERVCASGSAPDDILGEWFSPNYPGAVHVFPMEMPVRFPAFVEFTKDKRVFFRSTAVKSRQGEYEFVDGLLVLRSLSEPPLKSKPHVSSDQIDIRITTKGPEIPFRRVPGSDCAAWVEQGKQR